MSEAENDTLPVVLVAEDDSLIRLGTADQLSAEGYEVVEATNAAEALAIIQSRPDIVVLFTDIDMPGEFNGMELAERVHRSWPGVRLLVTSGRAMLSDSDVPDDGMFLPKPYSEEKLAGTLKTLLDKHAPEKPD